jgi:hypothetical protein
MFMEVIVEKVNGFMPCAHCSGTGTCNNGQDKDSCHTCKKEQKIKLTERAPGLVCSVCGGVGIAEPKSYRIHNRIVPILALLIVYMALILIWINASKENFSEILAFAGTLIGSVTGYYFGGKNNKT